MSLFQDIPQENPLRKGEFVGALDCGTTYVVTLSWHPLTQRHARCRSTRFIVFDEVAQIVVVHQAEFPQYYPNPGWHEHDPVELYNVVVECLEGAATKLKQKGWCLSSVKVIGASSWRSHMKVIVNRLYFQASRTNERLPSSGPNPLASRCAMP